MSRSWTGPSRYVDRSLGLSNAGAACLNRPSGVPQRQKNSLHLGGKSLSTISLLATDWQQSANEFLRPVPTLVVVPPSLLRTWEAQLRQHLHPGTLRCLLYHGPNRSDEITLILTYDVVITTYNIVATE